jgi:abequosyltransferase
MSEGPETPHAITRPLLTIAIPTHKRAGCLKELLSLLADQIKNEPRVELMISDNASPDDTLSVVRDFMAKGVCIRYIRNPEDIGPDANFLQCFEQARGKYVWLFSDDDLIVPGGVEKILTYCEASDYDLIFVSGYPFAKFHIPPAATPDCDALELTDAREYTKHVHIFFTFISGNIINKDTVLRAGPRSFCSLVGTGLAQLGWTYTALNQFTRGLYIREKLIAVRANNTGGYKLFQVFGPQLAAITQKWLKARDLGEIILNGTVQRFWPLMFSEYQKNAKLFGDEAPPRTVLTPVFKSNFRYWIFVYPMMRLPVALARIWLAGTRIVNWLDKALGYPMLDWGVSADHWEAATERKK